MQTVMSVEHLQVAGADELLIDIPQLSIKQGCCVAVVGANGAGKSTFLETILGLRKKVRGKVTWMPEQGKLGAQLQKADYNTEFLVHEIITLHHKLYGRTDADLFEAFNIGALAKRKYGVLSRGEKQRVDLFVALAHRPQTIVMDEPGAGLDKIYYQAFIDKISQLRETRQSTVIMASHTALEVSLAGHVLWIENGRVRRYAEKQTLIDQLLGSVKVTLRCESAAEAIAVADRARKSISKLRLKEVSERQWMMFGEEALRPWIINLAASMQFSELSISDADEEDFLHYVAASRENQREGR